MLYLKDKLLLFTQWLYIKVSILLEPDGDFIIFSRYRKVHNTTFRGNCKNSLAACTLIMVRKLFSWEGLTEAEKIIAKEILIKDLGYKVIKNNAYPGTCYQCYSEGDIGVNGCCRNCQISNSNQEAISEPIQTDA